MDNNNEINEMTGIDSSGEARKILAPTCRVLHLAVSENEDYSLHNWKQLSCMEKQGILNKYGKDNWILSGIELGLDWKVTLYFNKPVYGHFKD